jgi:hypothetical protein
MAGVNAVTFAMSYGKRWGFGRTLAIALIANPRQAAHSHCMSGCGPVI